ncbi:zinc finger, CCHC-type containing protein [Tanacetum coccineum]
MLGSMSPGLQRALENYKAYDMIQELKTMFEEQPKQELFDTVKAFHACKQEDGQSVSAYILKMMCYLDTLERLGYAIPMELGVSLILNSLNKDYDHFVQNYNMHSMRKSIVELHAMLKLHEKGIPKKAETPTVLAIREGKIQKDRKKPQGAKGKDKRKNKLAYAPMPRSQCLLRENIRQRTLSATTARRVFRESIFVARNAEFFENKLMVQEASGSHGPLESSGSDEGFELFKRRLHIPSKTYYLWVLVELPPNGRTVGSKWIFKKKTDMDGYVHTFKARLVSKGYTQTYDIDYGETFSPVADIRAIRIPLAIATFYGYEIWQMDVKPAFLNGHLSEDVYMVQPEAFVVLEHPNRVCKLQRSIYGLKQSFKSSEAKNECEKSNKDTGLKTNEEPVDQEDQVFLEELERLKRQEKEANGATEALRKEFAQEAKDLLIQAGAARATSTNQMSLLQAHMSY